MNPAMYPQIAALLAQRGAGQTPASVGATPIKQRQYYGSIPEIAKAREADPRQQLANTLMANGSSTAPVAWGGWAWADGIARALSGVAGGIVNKKNDKRYSEREGDYVSTLANAAKLASTPQTQPPPVQPPPVQPPAPPPVQPPAQGSGPMTFDQAFQPFQQPPQPPQMASAAPLAGAGAQVPLPRLPGLASPTPTPARAPGASADQAATPSAPMNANDLYFKGIVPIEGGTDKSGKFRTSPKGAIGPGQVMPATAPIAARLAGVPFDDYKYRNDAQYNNLLGSAYYAEQLKTFGDPIKAAAAYNAGPGRVSRAVRRASREGGSWTDYLPAETKEYVESFKGKIGAAAGEAINGSTGAGAMAEAIPAIDVRPPQFENVNPLSQANYVPPEVETNRIAMAQQMLASGNPDMVALAQAYLDKGLTEQNDARTLRSDQQFRMGSQERGYEVDSRNRAEDRNFGRETVSLDQDFNARENAAQRAQQVGLANADRAFTAEQGAITRNFQADEAEKDRKARAAEIEATNTAKTSGWLDKDPLWTTPTGEKIREKLRTENSTMQDLLEKIDTFMAYNSKQGTGGWRSLPGVTSVEGGFNSDISAMNALANQITFEKLGGLGVAISDGDRNFVADSMLSTKAPGDANVTNAEILRGLIKRKLEYNSEYLRFRAENGPRGEAIFTELWDAYKQNVPVILKSSNGAQRNTQAISFQQWLASIPQEGG